MFSPDALLRKIAAASLIFLAPSLSSEEGPNLGRELTPEDVAPWAISIGPDGTGLPPGAGTVEQGEKIYQAKCLACHGGSGEGGLNDRLAGGHGSLEDPTPVRTIGSYWPYATTVFDYIRRAMPYDQPQSLRNDEVYALTSYLLYINGIINERQVMTQESLSKVNMPNRDNFIINYPRRKR